MAKILAVLNQLRKSWTILFNLAMVAAGWLALNPDVLPMLQQVGLSSELVALITAVGNILLRFKTNKPLSAK